jgi:RNA polymerase sigma-70 factor (ECF subfamily)
MEPSDGELLARCQKGDTEAFGVIVRRYMTRAYYAALALVGEHHEAMDLSQEAFARTYKAVKRFDLSKSFFPWYHKTLKNLWINRHRKGKGVRFTSLSPAEEDDGPHLEIASRDEGPFVAASKAETAEVLAREMGKLDPEKREILYLRHFDNLSYSQIAETLGIPEGTVMSRLFAARQALKGRMEKYL